MAREISDQGSNRYPEGGKHMKNLFQGLAQYNRSVNQSVLQLLEPLKKDQVMMKTKAFYPSIFETLLHILVADLNWLRRYRDAFKEIRVLNGSKLLSLEEKTLRTEFESDYKKLFQYRKQVDELISQFVNELAENQLNSTVRYKNYKGEEIEKESWKTLLHWFNHQTHHRGQVSVLLDLIGIDHDYSSLITRI
jgi:uncharacterized damage-inducible protein DinB